MFVICTFKLHRNGLDIFIPICIIPSSAFCGYVMAGVYLIVSKVTWEVMDGF